MQLRNFSSSHKSFLVIKTVRLLLFHAGKTDIPPYVVARDLGLFAIERSILFIFRQVCPSAGKNAISSLVVYNEEENQYGRR